MHLCLDIARTQVQHKQALQFDAALLDSSRQHDKCHNHQPDGNHDGISQMPQSVADEEDEGHGYEDAYQNGEQQGQTVAVALVPQRFPFFRAVFLHDHSPQEWRYKQYCQQADNDISPYEQGVARQQFVYKRQPEGEHHGDGGC